MKLYTFFLFALVFTFIALTTNSQPVWRGVEIPFKGGRHNNDYPTGLTVMHDKLYFASTGGPTLGARNLYVYNGTDSARPITNFGNNSLGCRLDKHESAVIEHTLYFPAADDINGNELWAYDTVNGARMVMDLCTGSCFSSPRYFQVIGADLYFEGRDSANGINYVFEYRSLGTTANKLFHGRPMGTFKNQLLVFGAQPGTTKLVHLFNPSTRAVKTIQYNTDIKKLLYPAVLDGKLYFVVSSTAYGDEIGVYDEASNTVTRITDICPGDRNGVNGALWPYNKKLFFVGANKKEPIQQNQAYDLLSFNPANNTTTLVYDFKNKNALVRLPYKVGLGKLYFYAEGDTNSIKHIWEYDDGPKKANPMEQTVITTGIDIGEIAEYKGHIYFHGGLILENAKLFRLDTAGITPPPTSIPFSSLNTKRQVVVYPNPVETTLNFVFAAESTGMVNIVMTDMYGRLVAEQQNEISVGANRIRIPVQDLAAGMYIYYLKNEAGEVTHKGKFLKQ